jgi:response regulator RpfG family c-di-GMP phosphodiesterase
LHDIGKIGIPDIVLNKPGKLDAEEWSKMKEHAQIGFDMLKNSTRPILKAASTIALEHHEKWDGSGYPDGKVKDETDILSRIVGLADVYDALGSKRSYKEPWTESDIVKLINDSKGSHFDPDLVDVFNKNLKKLASVREKLPD